jgi:hypothetical protein
MNHIMLKNRASNFSKFLLISFEFILITTADCDAGRNRPFGELVE